MVDVFHGMFAANSASGDQTITGVGFSGKVFLFYGVNQTNKDGSYSGHYRFSFGMADAVAKNSVSITGNSSDIVTNSDVGTFNEASGCISFCTASGSRGTRAFLKSVDGNSFTLTWDQQLAALAVSGWVCYDVFGGDDIVNQKIVAMRLQSGHGSQTVSGVGFSGNVAMAIYTDRLIDQAAPNTNMGIGIGMAVSSTQRSVICLNSEDAQNTSDTWRIHRTDRFIARLVGSTGLLTGNADFTDFNSDGITLNWISGAQTNAFTINLLVMKVSGNVAVSSFNTVTGTGNQDNTGVGFSGKYVMFMSTDTASNNANGASGNNRVSIGSVVDTGSISQGAIWAGDQDAAATMVNTRATSDTKTFIAAIENATDSSTSGTMIAEFVSFNSNGYTINKTTNAFNGDTSGMTISSLVIGDTISGAAPEVTPQDTRRQAFAGGNYPSPMLISTSPFPAQMPAYAESRPIFGPMRDFVQTSGNLY